MGVRRRTSPGKLQASVATFKQWIATHRNCRISYIMLKVRQKLLGYYGYYGVRGNMKSLSKLYYACLQLLFKWLNRRSQKRSYNWIGFNEMLSHFEIPPPKIVESPWQQRVFPL